MSRRRGGVARMVDGPSLEVLAVAGSEDVEVMVLVLVPCWMMMWSCSWVVMEEAA